MKRPEKNKKYPNKPKEFVYYLLSSGHSCTPNRIGFESDSMTQLYLMSELYLMCVDYLPDCCGVRMMLVQHLSYMLIV